MCRVIKLIPVLGLFFSVACKNIEVENKSPYLGMGEVVSSPIGFYAFCNQYPDYCYDDYKAEKNYISNDLNFVVTKFPNESSSAILASNYNANQGTSYWQYAEQSYNQSYNDDMPTRIDYHQYKKVIQKTNYKINKAITAKNDIDNNGMIERWSLPLSEDNNKYGDCEDYALEKKIALIKQGVPANSMFLATAMIKDVGLHAVLIVSTSRGDLILDNLVDNTKVVNEVNYSWIKRQSTKFPDIWYEAKESKKDKMNFIYADNKFMNKQEYIVHRVKNIS